MRKVWIAAGIYALVFGTLAAYRWHIWSYGSDTGTFAQAILDTVGGFRDGPEGGSHFRYHFSPVLALLFPIISLTGSPLSLQIAQVLLVAVTAPALFALVRPYLDERVALRLAVLALLYPPLASIAFGEFHELSVFPVLAVALCLAADRGEWWWFGVCAVGLLATREDVCIELAAIGLALAVVVRAVSVRAVGVALHRDSGPGDFLHGLFSSRNAAVIAFGVLGIAGAVVAAAYYREVFAFYGTWPHGHFYDYPFAHGPPAVLWALLTQPFVVLPAVLTLGRFTYVLEAIVPLALLPLRSWWSALALPGFAVVLLASEQSVWRMGNHYAAMWAPWLLIGTGAALAAIQRRSGIDAAVRWVNAAVVACVVFLVAFDPMHLGHYLTPPYADLASARRALECVPTSASVSTHDEWFAEIAASYPHATTQRTEGVDDLVYADDFPNAVFQDVTRPKLAAEVASGEYSVVCSFGHVKTYRRNSSRRL